MSTLKLQVQPNSHFLEEVPVGDDLELLQDEEDATADEEGLMFGQGLVQQQQVPFTTHTYTPVRSPGNMMSLPVLPPPPLHSPHSFSDVGKLHEVVLPEELVSRHVALKQQQQAASHWEHWELHWSEPTGLNVRSLSPAAS